MKTTIVLLFLVISQLGFVQYEDCDYKLLNEVFPTLIGKIDTNAIPVFENPIDFTNQKAFFTKETFNAYSYGVLGVDGNRVKELMNTLDFNYLSGQLRDKTNWELKNINYNVIRGYEEDKNSTNKVRQYSIAKPVYTKDKKFAFILYRISEYMSGSETVKVYKKVKGKWTYYVQFPITIS